jgi:two-component system, cell cycle response regulator
MLSVLQNELYSVDVIGFNGTERAMLSSIFALSARRDPGFMQHDPNSSVEPDLYLVDAEDPVAFEEFRVLSRREALPAVLVGPPADMEDVTTIARPLQWARLLQALGDAIGGHEQTAPAPLEGRASPPSAPLRSTDAEARARRAAGDVVLVVDDNATVRAFMQAKLAPFNFEVDFAESGEQAVGLTGTREYACVFLDVVLPGIDGYQVCKLIKSNKQAIKKTAVVMLTSRSSPFDKLRGSLAGCDEYLTKPLDEDRLLEVIAKFIPSERKRSERTRQK